MSNSNEKRESLSRNLRQRKVLALAGVVALILAIVGFFAFQTISERIAANEELAKVKDDYQATWCATFGADSYDTSVFETWYGFVDRNREFLESKEELKVTDGATGEVGLILEWELDWNYDIFVTNGPQPDFETAMVDLAPSIFWSTDELLALGVNEFGKPIPLPCN